jgi:hypothetical protein
MSRPTIIAEGSEEARGPIYEERNVLKQHVGGYRDFWSCGRCLEICCGGTLSEQGLWKGLELCKAASLTPIQLFVINEHMRSVLQRYEEVKERGVTR